MTTMPRFSQKRRELRIQAMCERSDARVKLLVKAGVSQPPVGDEQEYQQMLAWRDMGDPRYWDDRQAQARFAMLAQRFGTPAPIQQPFGVTGGANPAGVFRAGSNEQAAARGPAEETPLPPIAAIPHVAGIPDD